MKQEFITLRHKDDILNGVLTTAGPDISRFVILLHPHPLYGGDMNNHVISFLEQTFLSLGYSTLRFNFRGVSGKFDGINGAIQDATALVNYLENLGASEIGLVGYSFGGSVAIRLILSRRFQFLIALSASVDLLQEDDFDISSLSNVHVPTLLFHGDSDTMISPSDLCSFSTYLKGANLIYLENEDHFYNRTLTRVRNEIQTFISEI